MKSSPRVGWSGGAVVRWCWINFQYRGVLLIWIIVREGPVALAGGAVGGCLDIFSLVSLSLWEMDRYRLKYCKPKTTNRLPERGRKKTGWMDGCLNYL